MNFLAHLYLSGEQDDVMIGNFIGDHVKGNILHSFPSEVVKGIILHREIDSFTDAHPIVLKSKVRLRPIFHKYSPVIVDIFYDHCLAKNWRSFCTTPLEEFADRTYYLLNRNFGMLPERVKHFLPYMVQENWLYNYSTLDGIGRTLKGLSKRSKFENNMGDAVSDLEANYELYNAEFQEFFPDIIRNIYLSRYASSLF